MLQNGALLVFSICWVAVVDYLVFMFTCSWGHENMHIHWDTVGETQGSCPLQGCGSCMPEPQCDCLP